MAAEKRGLDLQDCEKSTSKKKKKAKKIESDHETLEQQGIKQ